MSPFQSPKDTRVSPMTAMDRLLLLETWSRSGLSGKDFSRIVRVSAQQLRGWKRRFERDGPAGLEDAKKGAPKGSRLPDTAAHGDRIRLAALPTCLEGRPGASRARHQR